MNRRQMGDGGHGPFTFRIQDRWPGGDAWVALGEGKLRMTCELLQVDINMVGHGVRCRELPASNWPSVWQAQLEKCLDY